MIEDGERRCQKQRSRSSHGQRRRRRVQVARGGRVGFRMYFNARGLEIVNMSDVASLFVFGCFIFFVN